MHQHPVIGLALSKQRSAMFEKQASDAALIASIRAERRAEQPSTPRRWRRRRVAATPRPVG